MTTRTLTGIAVLRDPANDNVIAIRQNIELDIVVRDSVTTFGYSLEPLEPGENIREGNPQVDDMTVRMNNVVFGDGHSIDARSGTFIQAAWTQGGAPRNTTVFEVTIENWNDGGLGNVHADFYFILAGDPLNISSPADWATLEASLVSVSNPTTGPYAPGANIPLSALGGTVSENDLIQGNNDNNNFDGGIGNDTIFGFGGNDTLLGGAGSDELIGGDGNDLLNPGDNNDYDWVMPGAGNDTVDLSGISNGYVDLAQNDLNAAITVNLDSPTNTATINKGANGTTTILNVNNPIISGQQNGGLGIHGTDFADVFNINQNHGWMSVRGNGGNDTINIGADTNTLRIDYRGGNQGVNANLETGIIQNDGFGSQDQITGPGRAHEIRTGMFNDTVLGSSGNDSFILMAGTDSADGGAGFDRVRYDRTGVDAVTVDLETGTATGMWRGEAFTHSLTSIEYVRGSRNGNDNIKGSNAAGERLAGRGGNDTLDGRGGNDTLIGGDGNDLLEGGTGTQDHAAFDVARGAATITVNGGTVHVSSSEGNDTLTGIEFLAFSDQTVEVASLNGGGGGSNTPTAGDDTLTGTMGADLISGLGGNDQISGLGGNDTLYGGPGMDTLDGGDGDDLLGGSPGDDDLNGGNGDDQAYGAAGNDTLRGGEGNDVLGGSIGNDLLLGEGGNDGLWGAGDNDTLVGGDGADTLGGSAGDDSLDGGNGDDELWGAGDNDTLVGGDGADTLGGATGDDSLDGGNDADEMWGALGNDTLAGGSGNDTLGASSGNDSLDGGAGDDELWGAIGNDTLDGGDGDDSVGAGADDDIARGGGGNDQVFGGLGNDAIFGDAGNDTLYGAAGDDTIDGGDGDDEMFAGTGADVIVFSPGSDTVQFFSTAFDEVDLSGVAEITDFADLQANHLSDVGGNAIITDGLGNSLTLTNVLSANLEADDFIF